MSSKDQQKLTSRAQARGTNQREPRSGTEGAIPRCLQRFVRWRHDLLIFSTGIFTLGNCNVPCQIG